MTMEWKQLMSRMRLDAQGNLVSEPEVPARTDFERDWDRVLFSTAFRRLHDKTQVFPLPEDDHVHSRLTHSLEVASVGRSLGRIVGRSVIETHSLGPGLSGNDFGGVVAAACLVHDIGNPPLGHAGEDAIAAFFRSPAGEEAISGLHFRQREDLRSFEGNAQGFRVLMRLEDEDSRGLQLTAATMASFLKYPRAAGDDLKHRDNVARKKHGFCQGEQALIAALAGHVGLLETPPGPAWARHPLAFLVEAADDICYSILDIEDGVRLGRVDAQEADEFLRPLARKSGRFDEQRAAAERRHLSAIEYLRSRVIACMIDECAKVFLAHEAEILGGQYNKALTDAMPSSAALVGLKALAKEKCYCAREVVELELAGYEALRGLLECFVPAVLAADAGRDQRTRTTLSLLRSQGVRLDEAPEYDRIMRVVDLVSGMTDRYALAMYRRIKGISIPGRVG